MVSTWHAAAPDFCDAALMDVLVRFWWYDSIGAHQQRQLREALNRMGAVDLGDLALPPTALLAAGLRTREAAAALAMLLAVSDLGLNHYWYGFRYNDNIRYYFFEDCSIIGGLLLLAATTGGAPHALSLDAWRDRQLQLRGGAAADEQRRLGVGAGGDHAALDVDVRVHEAGREDATARGGMYCIREAARELHAGRPLARPPAPPRGWPIAPPARRRLHPPAPSVAPSRDGDARADTGLARGPRRLRARHGPRLVRRWQVRR